MLSTKVDNGEFLLNNPGKIDLHGIRTSKNIRDFDLAAVVPVMGYRDVEHYYTEASACRVSGRITTPTVALSSADDPVCSVEGCPTTQEALGPGLVVVQTQKGGHVSFMEGVFPTSRGWMDAVAEEWFLNGEKD
jgi:abhydrolase domain-containing protein 1/3